MTERKPPTDFGMQIVARGGLPRDLANRIDKIGTRGQELPAYPDRFCASCGRQLFIQREGTGGFSETTGNPVSRLWYVCPLWHRWLRSGHGHYEPPFPPSAPEDRG